MATFILPGAARGPKPTHAEIDFAVGAVRLIACKPAGSAMSFRTDNDAYEAWLATQCDVVKEDTDYKHHRMNKSAFTFLRATYFRWARKIGTWCPELMDAPQVLSVGDLHLENFGTWRDADGRLVWGSTISTKPP